jgi:hypothetical protein
MSCPEDENNDLREPKFGRLRQTTISTEDWIYVVKSPLEGHRVKE